MTFAHCLELDRHGAPHAHVNSPVMLDDDDSVLASHLPDIDIVQTDSKTCAVSMETNRASESLDTTWHKVESVKLLASDKQLIACSNGLLNDKIIHAAMLLLQIQYPQQAGLNDPILCFAGHANVDSANMSFVQIVNDPDKCHWITVSNKHRKLGEIDVYCSARQAPSLSCANAVSRFARVPASTMELRVANVAPQSDAYCCGLYAVACSCSCFRQRSL